jgi:hypothetical protein
MPSVCGVQNEDDSDDLHPLNYVPHAAYHTEKISRERVERRTAVREKGGSERGTLAIDLYEINHRQPIEDDKSILFSANHEARGESNGDY